MCDLVCLNVLCLCFLKDDISAVDISDNELTAIELKFVPSATNKLPAVFVPIVISSPDTVRSPPTVLQVVINIVPKSTAKPGRLDEFFEAGDGDWINNNRAG